MKIHLIYATKDYTKKMTILNGQDMANVKKEIKKISAMFIELRSPKLIT